jgi:hypothetical protein
MGAKLHHRKHHRHPPLAGTSLGLFPETNLFRRALYAVVVHPLFDNVMFFVIGVNCVVMAVEYPDISKENLDGMIVVWA